jgi:hypothetical protein
MKSLFILSAMLLVASPILADQSITTHIASQPNSPVSISYCEARLTDSESGLANYTLNLGADFTDGWTQPAAAVRVRFSLKDAFGAGLHDIGGTSVGPFPIAKKVSAAGTNGWDTINVWSNTIDSVTCSIDSVKFADGTIWKDGDQQL